MLGKEFHLLKFQQLFLCSAPRHYEHRPWYLRQILKFVTEVYPTSQVFLVRPPTVPAIPAMTICENRTQFKLQRNDLLSFALQLFGKGKTRI